MGSCSAVICMFLVLQWVFGEEGLLTPCSMSDLPCIRNTTQQFLENTANGIPAFNISPIDPMKVSKETENGVPEEGATCELNDNSIMGLRNLNITHFEMNLEKKHVQLTMRMSLNMEGNIKIHYVEKVYEGSYHASTKLTTVTSYGYEINTDSSNVEHYEVLPETIEYDFEDITFELSDDLVQSLVQDGKSEYSSSEYGKKYEPIVKKILKPPAHTLISNLREAARRLPRSAFFTDV